MPAYLSILLVLAVIPLCQATAQVGDTTGVRYPGWHPADRVIPGIAPQVTYDSAARVWVYAYVLTDSATAAQPIRNLRVRYNGATTSATPPTGWFKVTTTPGMQFPGTSFVADSPDGVIDSYADGPSPWQIPPGQSLGGFTITSAYPPGYGRAYVQGFAGIPYADDSLETITPDDTTNAQRRYALAPTRYTQVITGGNRNPGVDGFLGFMNLATSGSTTIDPTPIALKFSLNGETVDRTTFHATLNGTDVTASFHRGPADGADLVAVFAIGSSPLVSGKNVLLTSVDGVKPGTTQRATDTDRIVFTVNTNPGPTFTSNSLENLPMPDPVTLTP